MKKGDLVIFECGFPHWQREYDKRNPGIVVSSKDPDGSNYDKGHATVLWSDGSVSQEHLSFLRVPS